MSGAGQADLSHTLIIAEEGSQVVVLEDNLSTTPDASGLHSGAVEIFAGQNANVTYVQVQRWNRQVWNFASHRAMVARDAHLCWVTATFGGRLNKINQAVVLEGAGGNAKMLGLAFTDARQHLDISTAQEHVSPHTSAIYCIGLSSKTERRLRGVEISMSIRRRTILMRTRRTIIFCLVNVRMPILCLD